MPHITSVIAWTDKQLQNYLQWNLSNTDTFATKIIVLINEVSLFQGENDIQLYKSRLKQVS